MRFGECVESTNGETTGCEDIVDWDKLSLDFEADENPDKFNCPFINYEAKKSSGDDCIEANEQLHSKKLTVTIVVKYKL